jgi:hypothetical protein
MANLAYPHLRFSLSDIPDIFEGEDLEPGGMNPLALGMNSHSVITKIFGDANAGTESSFRCCEVWYEVGMVAHPSTGKTPEQGVELL